MASGDALESSVSWTNDLTVAMPGTALLELASDLLWALDQSYLAQEDQVEADDDDDGNGYCELMSLRADLSHVQYRLDPYRWALERARHGRETMPEEAEPDVNTRLEALLQLGAIPKAVHVVPLAIALRRQQRQLQMTAGEAEGEDALLDFLGWLSSQRLSTHLFKIVSN